MNFNTPAKSRAFQVPSCSARPAKCSRLAPPRRTPSIGPFIAQPPFVCSGSGCRTSGSSTKCRPSALVSTERDGYDETPASLRRVPRRLLQSSPCSSSTETKPTRDCRQNPSAHRPASEISDPNLKFQRPPAGTAGPPTHRHRRSLRSTPNKPNSIRKPGPNTSTSRSSTPTPSA